MFTYSKNIESSLIYSKYMRVPESLKYVNWLYPDTAYIFITIIKEFCIHYSPIH